MHCRLGRCVEEMRSVSLSNKEEGHQSSGVLPRHAHVYGPSCISASPSGGVVGRIPSCHADRTDDSPNEFSGARTILDVLLFRKSRTSGVNT